MSLPVPGSILAQTIYQFRLSLPGRTICGSGVTSAILAGVGLWMQFHHCFPAGTPVSTESGQRPIESIQPGERVWAFDVQDGQWKLRHVLRTFSHLHEGQLVSMKVGGETIESTPGHPFWVFSGEDLELRPRPDHVPIPPWQSQLPGRWVDAGDLRVGDVLYLKSGALAPIEELTLRHVREMVYNFQVEELESYAVGSGAVLVHNTSTPYQGQPGEVIDPQRIPVYRGGVNLQLGPNDVRIDRNTGLVRPTHGLSVDTNPCNLRQHGGLHRVIGIPPELQIRQRGQRLELFEIMPRVPMPFETFQQLLNQVVLEQ